MDSLFKWYEIVFTELRPETDFFMYRQMAEMLVPQKNCVNRFRMVSSRDFVDFYIGSNDDLSLRFLKSFFFRLYALKFEELTDELPDPEISELFITKGVKEGAPMVSPSLMQNLAFLREVSESDVITDVAIYNTGKSKAGMAFRVGLLEKSHDSKKIMERVRDAVKNYAKTSGTKTWRIRRERQFVRARGVDPRFLINMVRIPLDEDI